MGGNEEEEEETNSKKKFFKNTHKTICFFQLAKKQLAKR
jgi:hypothetical protein